MKSRIVCLCVVAACQLPISAQSLGCHDLQGITPIAQELLTQFPSTGSSCVRVDLLGTTVYEQAFGSFTLQQVVPIASATKTLSAAVLLSLVDSGLLALDDRVGQYLPEWNVGSKALITLRMCFTHTSGLSGSSPLISDDTITLRQAALQLANDPLQNAPGSRFLYGGVSMHVAGAVGEVAAGQSWAQLFQQRIATPLQMSTTDFYAFGFTQNPRIAGGARCNLRDYAVFVDMLRNGGVWNGVQVLSPASVDTMLSDQTSSIPIASTPHPDSAPYGIGIWLDRRDSQGRTLLASGVGAFGFAGWVDRAHGASGVFLVRNQNSNTFPLVQRSWREIDAAVLPVGIGCVGAGSPACAAGAWLNGSGPARAGNADFALFLARAPANGLGLVVLGDPLPAGLPLLDLVAFVGPGLDVVAGLIADAAGRATLAAPLAGSLAGLTFAVQVAWLEPTACASSGLQATHAIAIAVQP